MSFELNTFVRDLLSLPIGHLAKKYKSYFPADLDVEAVLLAIRTNGLELGLIDRNWTDSDPALNGYFMTFDGNSYSVFLGERQGQHWLRKFDRFDEAAKYKIKLMINEIKSTMKNANP
jgi:hypothetical protein